MLRLLPNIDLELTGACNLKCPGCWGTPRQMPMMHSFDDLYGLLQEMKKFGLKSVTLSGGEPTLLKGLDNFIARINSELGLEIYLQTNGFFLIPLMPKIAPYVHTISLSLEGSNPEINAFRRGPKAFDKVMDCLAYLDKYTPDIKVKIGTCVFKQNIEDLPKLGEVLLERGFGSRYPDRGVWKLYQITRFGAGKDDKLLDSMLLTDHEFRQMANTVESMFKGNINFTSIASNEMGGYCMIVRPDGKIVANGHSELGEEIEVFDNIFSDIQGGIQAIIDFQNPKHVQYRLEKTYFFEWGKKQPPKTLIPIIE